MCWLTLYHWIEEQKDCPWLLKVDLKWMDWKHQQLKMSE
jgi:hypothetical protein